MWFLSKEVRHGAQICHATKANMDNSFIVMTVMTFPNQATNIYRKFLTGAKMHTFDIGVVKVLTNFWQL